MTQTVERASRPRLTLVIPCRNEEQALPQTAIRLVTLLEELTQEMLTARSSICLVDDGSTDSTWRLIGHSGQLR